MQEGGIVTSTYLRPTHLACGKYAIMQNAKKFTLVPWQQLISTGIGTTLDSVTWGFQGQFDFMQR
jgi:hypothetical protein